ncbi:MAG: DUF4159 domain-containing protein [Limisphaerales bacterium]
MKNKIKHQSLNLCRVIFAAVYFLAPPVFSQLAPLPGTPVHSDLTLLQCGNLIYAGDKSSVCFADRFLTDVANQTNLRVNKKLLPVRLDAETLFDYPFCVMSGNEEFALTQKEREQLRKYLTHGGFLLVSPGCSDEKWDKSFRQEMKLCFPEYPLQKIPMTHPIFSIVNPIPRLWKNMAVPWRLKDLRSWPAGSGLFQGRLERCRKCKRLLLLRRQ